MPAAPTLSHIGPKPDPLAGNHSPNGIARKCLSVARVHGVAGGSWARIEIGRKPSCGALAAFPVDLWGSELSKGRRTALCSTVSEDEYKF